jgi:hypothetical protein
MDMKEDVITFDRTKTKKLRKEYEKAVAEDKTVFVFEGHTYISLYAKYLLQYLDARGLGDVPVTDKNRLNKLHIQRTVRR